MLYRSRASLYPSLAPSLPPLSLSQLISNLQRATFRVFAPVFVVVVVVKPATVVASTISSTIRYNTGARERAAYKQSPTIPAGSNLALSLSLLSTVLKLSLSRLKASSVAVPPRRGTTVCLHLLLTDSCSPPFTFLRCFSRAYTSYKGVVCRATKSAAEVISRNHFRGEKSGTTGAGRQLSDGSEINWRRRERQGKHKLNKKQTFLNFSIEKRLFPIQFHQTPIECFIQLRLFPASSGARAKGFAGALQFYVSLVDLAFLLLTLLRKNQIFSPSISSRAGSSFCFCCGFSSDSDFDFDFDFVSESHFGEPSHENLSLVYSSTLLRASQRPRHASCLTQEARRIFKKCIRLPVVNFQLSSQF